MADKKITQLTAAVDANITDAALFEMVNSLGASVKATIAQVRTAILTVTASLSIVCGATTITAGLGAGAIASNTTFGNLALVANTTGAQNTAFGKSALAVSTTGANNSAFGYLALRLNAAGSDSNSAFGGNALASNTTGNYNTSFGANALFSMVTASGSTAIGKDAGYSATAAAGVYLGYFAGKYETGGSALYVDAIDRTNTAGDKAGALLYGTFNATVASQTLRVNGAMSFGPAASAVQHVFDGTGYGAAGASIRLNGLTSGAAAQVGTLTNAPSAGNPTFWIPVSIAGAIRYIPAWT